MPEQGDIAAVSCLDPIMNLFDELEIYENNVVFPRRFYRAESTRNFNRQWRKTSDGVLGVKELHGEKRAQTKP